jgi:hypothetical protein
VTAAQLRDLLRLCLVQINTADGTPAGSGFFVAPGYIVSCAHVVRRPAGNRVTGIWSDQPWSGEVVGSSEPPGSADTVFWPEPDLAIIRVEDDGFDHPCARLAGREPNGPAPMFAIGRRAALDIPGDFPSAELHYAGRYLYLMRLTGDRFWPGMSGGPVVDLSTGAVCGVLKTAESDRDGYAVPIRLLAELPVLEVLRDLLRAHDHYHNTNRAWIRAQESLELTGVSVPPLLSPASETELLALVAMLPYPDQAYLGNLYQDCADPVLHPRPGELRDWRDIAFALSEHLHERGRLHPVILFAESLATAYPEIAAPLRDWATVTATLQSSWELLRARRAGEPVAQAGRRPAQRAGPMSAAVQLEPSARSPDHYLCTLWRCRADSDVVLVERDNEPHPIPEIIAKLAQTLPDVLGQLPDAPIVEFILPVDLFDLPVHTWQVLARQYAALGLRYPVVIRDLERCNDEESRNHAMTRWDWLSAQATVATHWLGCADSRTDAEIYQWFEQTSERAAFGLAGPASSWQGALNAAIYAGAVVGVWRRESCVVRDGCDNEQCQGSAFRNAVESMLMSNAVHELPSRIRSVRTAGTRDPALGEVSLMWDNPHRGPHPRRLAVQ